MSLKSTHWESARESAQPRAAGFFKRDILGWPRSAEQILRNPRATLAITSVLKVTAISVAWDPIGTFSDLSDFSFRPQASQHASARGEGAGRTEGSWDYSGVLDKTPMAGARVQAACSS
jgi:hypothetical protein